MIATASTPLYGTIGAMFRHGLAAAFAVFVLAGVPPEAMGQPGATGPA